MKIKKKIQKIENLLDTASNLFNNLLRIYSNQFNEFKPNKKKKKALTNRPKRFSFEELKDELGRMTY